MRSHIIDSRIMPVENLATNPSFERVISGTGIIRRNLATRPKADSIAILPAGNIGVRASRWFGSAQSGTYEVKTGVSDAPAGLTTYVRKTWTSGAPTWNGDTGFDLTQFTSSSFVVTPGQTYTFSSYMRPSINKNGNFDLYTYDSTGTLIKRENQNGIISSTALPANIWTRLSFTWTVPAGVAYASLVSDANSQSTNGAQPWSTGDYIDITGLLVELRPGLLPYFDGSTVNNSGLSYSWEGTASASSSVAKGTLTSVRRNLESNPNPAAAYGAPAPSSAAVTTETSNPPLGTKQYWRATCDSTAGTVGFDSKIALSVSAGFTGTRSLYVKLSKAATVSISLIGTGASGATTIANPSVSVAANTWTRIYLTATTAVAGDFGVRLRTTGASFVAGDTIDVGAMLTEGVATLDTYFDGNITPDVDLIPGWTGTANGSNSILYGVSPINVTGDNSLVIQSAVWKQSLTSSIRVMARGSNGWSNALVAGSRTTLSGLGIDFVAGSTYTVMATLRFDQPQTAPIVSSARRIEVQYGTISNTPQATLYSTQSPNTPGVYSHRVTFTLPPDSTWCTIRLYNGCTVQDVYWDGLAVIQGAYTGPYLDGDMPGCSWRSTPHNSSSIGYPSGV